MRTIQDKGLQKLFYQKEGIPTPDFYLVENKAEIDQYLTQMPFMQKMRKGGYDGKGVTPLKSEADLETAFDAPSVLESFVDLKKELSVIVARNERGEMKSFPVVELEFNPEANLVEYLFSPASISEDVETKAREVAELVANKLDIVGLLVSIKN